MRRGRARKRERERDSNRRRTRGENEGLHKASSCRFSCRFSCFSLSSSLSSLPSAIGHSRSCADEYRYNECHQPRSLLSVNRILSPEKTSARDRHRLSINTGRTANTTAHHSSSHSLQERLKSIIWYRAVSADKETKPFSHTFFLLPLDNACAPPLNKPLERLNREDLPSSHSR